MGIYTKKCDVCEEEMNKLSSLSNIYFLKTGVEIKCLNCDTSYKTNKIIAFLFFFYTWGGLWLAPLFLIVYLIDSFNFNFGFEVWLYAFLIYTIIEFFIMIYIPLKKNEEKK